MPDYPFPALANLTSPFPQGGQPPNPAMFRPSPPTDQTRTTADILSALARSLFSGAQGGADFAQYLTGTGSPSVAQPAGTPTAGALPGEMRVDPNVLYAPGQPPLRGEYRIPPGILNPASPGGGVAPRSAPGSTPPPSPGGGSPDQPPMLRPAPDGGDAVAGGDPASVLATAVQAGSLAQNDPDITKSVIQDLMAMGGDPDQNKWLALAKAGFAMAASRNPSIFGAAGEGALAGLSDYMDSRKQGLAYRYQAAQLQQAAQEHAAQIAYQQQQQALAQREFDEKVSEFQKTLPADLALKAAQAEYYNQHGNYFDARANMPGGGSGNPSDTALMHYNAALSTNMKLYLSAMDPSAAMQPDNIERARQWAVANTPRPNSVQTPGGGAPAGGGADQGATIAAAKQAIASGADPGQVKARLQQMGIDPSVLGQ